MTNSEWWAKRWWTSATDAERDAMRALVAAVPPVPDAGQLALPVIDKNDLFGAGDRVAA